MKISIAQTQPVKGDIEANIGQHQSLVELAVGLKSSAIFFPELSITGYEPELAKTLVSTKDDPRLDVFQKMSNASEITIGLGMPTSAPEGICISMIVFQPGLPRQTYSKQHLHEDEVPYFIQGQKQILLEIQHQKIAPAICYESLQDAHAENAMQMGASVYLASVAKSQKGVDKARVHYPAIAKKYSIPVLMTNCVGFCDNFHSVGSTAVWNKEGRLLAQMNQESMGILVFDTHTEEVVERILE